MRSKGRRKGTHIASGARSGGTATTTKTDLQKLIHELEVQQEEVRIQNAQLIESQQLLEESRDRYANLYDFAPVAYLTLCEAGVIREINVPGAAMLGQSRGQLVDRPFLHFVEPVDRRRLLEHLRRCRVESRSISLEFSLRTKDKRIVPVQLSSNPAVMETGGLRIRSAIIDLTERKQAEKDQERFHATRASEQLLQTVLRTLPVGVRVINRQGRVLLSNEISKSIWGELDMPLDRSVDLGGRMLESDTRLTSTNSPIARVLNTGTTIINELIGLDDSSHPPMPGRHERYVHESVVPLRDSDEEIFGVVAVSEDVTAQIQGEARLRDALEAAEQASRVKDEFLAISSHELRTPISAVLLWVHLLKGCLDNVKERQEAMEMIEQSARVQANLVNDLLDVSRMVVGKMRLTFKPQDLGTILQASVESVRPIADAKKVKLTTRIGSEAAIVSVDAERLQQVFWNLLANAIKFTPDGGRIDVALSVGTGHASVRIKDSGVGIDPQYLPHVFDRFWQADGTITRKHGGLGLGLSISRQLVEMHAGKISAESAGLDQGSTFTVELPLSDQIHTGAPRPKVGPSRKVQAGGGALKGVRVLLVEDEQSTRVALARLLRGVGAVVTQAASAAAAYRAYRTSTVDILLSDISMPDEDGCTLLRRLRSMEMKKAGSRAGRNGSRAVEPAKNPEQLPAIALTAHARPQDMENTLAAGFQAHLCKPVEPDRLISLMAELAAGSHEAGTRRERQL